MSTIVCESTARKLTHATQERLFVMPREVDKKIWIALCPPCAGVQVPYKIGTMIEVRTLILGDQFVGVQHEMQQEAHAEIVSGTVKP